MIYLVLALYLLFLAYKYDFHNRQKGRSFHFWLTYIFMVSLIALRYRVGGDTLNYIAMFDNTPEGLYALELLSKEKLQPIPVLIFGGCKLLFDDFFVVQAIFSLIVNTVFFLFLRRNTRYYFTAILLYGLVFYMRLNCEIMRESLAISFFLLAYPSLREQKFFRYYLFAVLAFLCHSSAIFIFVLPIFFVRRQKAILLLTCFSIIGGVFLLKNGSYVQNLTHYAEAYSDYKSSIFGKLSIIIFNIIIPSYIYSISKNYLSDHIKKGVIIYIICSVFSLFIYIAYRFNNYLMVFYIIMVAEFINYNIKNKSYNLAVARVAIVAFLFLYTFMGSYFTDVSKYVGRPAKWYCVWYPYYSIFDQQEDEDRELFIQGQRKQ